MRDFGISEILQLIGHQKKSGTLLVEDKNRHVEILFEQGNIVNSKHEPVNIYFDFESILVRSKTVEKSVMDQAKKEQSHNLKPLEQVLLDSSAIDLKTLKEIIVLSHLENIYDLFLWKDGNYSFDQGAVNYNSHWITPIASEQVLMDGYRVKDEWPLIESRVPDTTLAVNKVPGDFGPGDKLNSEQKKMYSLIDGERTADDLVFLSLSGRFEGLKTLSSLIENGRAVIDVTKEVIIKRDLTSIWIAAGMSLIFVVALTGVINGLFCNLNRLTAKDTINNYNNALNILWSWHQLSGVSSELSLYSAINRRYPESLASLIEEGIIKQKDIETVWGEFSYEVDGGGKSAKLEMPTPGD
jgi:uncharacterized protein DUF4388